MEGFGILPCNGAVDAKKKLGTIEATLCLIQMRSLRPRKEKLLAQRHKFA